MKFNYLIIFLLFQVESIRPLNKNNENKFASIDFKINFDKMVQVSLTKHNLNTNNNFFLQINENKNNFLTQTEKLNRTTQSKNIFIFAFPYNNFTKK